MLTRSAIVQEARTWLGVPYHHLQASRYGTDCAGLLLGIAMALGLIPASWRPLHYLSPSWYLHSPAERLLDELRAWALLVEIPLMATACGDILAFAWQGRPVSHVALVTRVEPSPTILHAVQAAGRVIECGLQGRWALGLRTAFTWAGVQA